MNLNKAILIGRVTADPQLRTIPSGQSVATFSVATNRTWTGKTGNREEEVEFHNVVAWGRQAEIASQFLTKGQLIVVEGRLRTRSWQDKQGQNHRTTEIICERLQLGPRPAGFGGQTSGADASRGSTPRSSAPSGDAMSGGAKQAASPSPSADLPPLEDIPVINLEDEAKPEDLPF